MNRKMNWTARGLAALGLLIILAAIVMHWRYGEDFELSIVLVGAGIMWYGGYLDNRKAALDGGNFVVDSLVKLGSVFRFTRAMPGGNRAEDKAAIPTVVIPTTDQSAPPSNPVQWKDGKDSGVL